MKKRNSFIERVDSAQAGKKTDEIISNGIVARGFGMKRGANKFRQGRNIVFILDLERMLWALSKEI